MAIQDYCIGLKGAVNAIHRVTRALSGNVNSTTISDAVEEVAIAIENGGGGGGGGTTDHTKLQNRDNADQHPIGAITGLETKLNEKANVSNTYTKSEVDSSLATKQEKLQSGTNIKTINDESLLGGGNINTGSFGIGAGDNGLFISGKNDKGNNTSFTIYGFDNKAFITLAGGDLGESVQIPLYDGNYIDDMLIAYASKTYVDTADTNLQTQIDALEAPVQTQGNWMYKVYSDGTFDAWYKATGQSLTITATSGNLYRSELQTLILPTDLTDGKTVTIQTATPGVSHNNYPVWGILASIQGTEVRYYALSGGSRTASPNYIVTAHVFGTIQ